MTTQKMYDDVSVVLHAAISSATRPVTFDVSDALDLGAGELTPNFDVRIENELLRVTAVSLDGGGAGIDRWTASHLGGAAASTHAAGTEVDVILTASGLTQFISDNITDDDSTLVPQSDYSAKGKILVGTGSGTHTALSVGADTQVLTADSTQASGVKWAAGGGGGTGAATTDHFIVGQGGEGDTDLSAKIIIPRLSGDPDIRVAGANDWEFDGGSSFSSFNSLTGNDENTTAKSHLFIKQNSNGSADAFKGMIKQVTATIPFTVTARLLVGEGTGGCWAVLFVSDSATAAGNSVAVGPFAGRLRSSKFTNLQTLAGISATYHEDAGVAGIVWCRIVVNSTTSVDTYSSRDGLMWSQKVTGHNPGFGGTRYVGIALDAFSAYAEMAVDYLRFT